MRRLRVAIGLMLLASLPVLARADSTSLGFVSGSNPAAFVTVKRCEGGANDSRPCLSGSDCTGGSCVTSNIQEVVSGVNPKWVRGQEATTCTGTAQHLIGHAQAPTDTVRVYNASEDNILYWGYSSSVSDANGAMVWQASDDSIPTPPSSLDANDIWIFCQAGDVIRWATPAVP